MEYQKRYWNIILLVLLLGLIPGMCSAYSWNYYQLTEGSDSVDTIDIALDSAGNPHAVYQRAGNVYYKNQLSGEELVGTGTSPAIAMDPSDVPHIVYIGTGSVVNCTNKTGGTWQTPVTVASSGVADIAVDSSGYDHIVTRYDFDTSGDSAGYVDIVYINNAGGTFTPATIWSGTRTSPYSGTYYNNYYDSCTPNIKIDGDGNYHIISWHIFTEQVPGEIYRNYEIVYATNAGSGINSGSGLEWKVEHSIGRNSLTLSGDVPHVVFNNVTNMVYAIPGASWTKTGLGSATSPAISAASSGTVGIAYVSTTADLEYIENSGSGFGAPELIENVGSGPALALGSVYTYYLKSDGMYNQVWAATDPEMTEPPVAAFSVNPTRGMVPLTVNFQDESTGADTWEWDFGDSSKNSSESSPGHEYTGAGTYTVTLTVTNSGGTSTVQKTGVITAIGPAPTVAGIDPDTGVNTTIININNITGTDFTAGASVLLTPVNVNPVHKSNITNGEGGALLLEPMGNFYVSGNYAYLSGTTSHALEIVNITDPGNPVHEGSITHGTGGALLFSPRGVYVSGNYAYVASYLSNALEIVNVTDPANPVHEGSIVNGDGEIEGDGGALLPYPQGVFVSGNYAYVISTGLEIVDVTDPSNPVHRAHIADGDGGALLSSPRGIYVSGNYAYLACAGSDALEIVDVTDPANPVHIGSITNGDGGALLAQPQGVFISGNYAYVTSVNSRSLEIVDITDPANPVHIGSIANGDGGALLDGPDGVFVSGNHAYVASQYSNALEIVNITDRANPLHAGSIVDGDGGALLISTTAVCVSDGYAYLTSTNRNALEIVNIGTVTGTGVNVASPTEIDACTFNLTSMTAGLYNVVVTNPDGQFGVLSGGFAITSISPAPTVSGITPGTGVNTTSVLITNLSGTNFQTSGIPTVNLTRTGYPNITANGVNVISSTMINCTLPITGAMAGTWDVVVTNPDGQSGTLAGGFTITSISPAPTVTGITPGTGVNTTSVLVTNLSGTNFSTLLCPFGTNVTVNLTRSGYPNITANGVNVISSTMINCTLPITGAMAGTWDVVVTNPDGQSGRLAGGFTITQGTRTENIGVFRPSTHTFYLDYNGNGAWNGASVDRQYAFGLTGDIPVSGDWDNNGITEIGVFRNLTHTFYLDYNGNGAWNGASADRQYVFGVTGDTPVSGDWDNDGFTEIGVFRNSTHTFYLDYNGNGIWNGASVDRQYIFGVTGDIPVSGDWDNDGFTEIGVFRPATHKFYLDYNGNGAWDGATDSQYIFGMAGDTPVSGDWDNDGFTEIGVFRSSTHAFYLDYNGNGAWNGASVDRQYVFGTTGDIPVWGKWS